MRPEQIGIGTRESPGDVARNLSRWVDGLVARTFSHALVEELARSATIPVINGLTDLLHPCQVMADFQTMAEHSELEDAAIAYVGDGNNMANSWINAAALFSMDLRLACPEGYDPDKNVLDRAKKKGARIEILLVDPTDDVRASQNEQIVVALKTARMIAKPVAPEILLCEARLLDHRAHRSVEEEDPLFDQLLELLCRSVVAHAPQASLRGSAVMT